MQHRILPAVAVCAATLACRFEPVADVGKITDGTTSTGAPDPGTLSVASTSSDSDTTATTGAPGGGPDVESSGTDDDVDGPKLDVAPTDSGAAEGCTKIDFLFVIDDSGSMSDEQQSLVASFAGFIETIETVTETADYHVMIVDSSAGPELTGTTCNDSACNCFESPLPDDHSCCFAACSTLPGIATCDDAACDAYPYPTGCDVARGAGRNSTYMYESCDFASGARYIDSSEPDIAAAFACAAVVGVNSDAELPMEAMTEALGPLAAVDGCNQGFLRDDAILVVTIITDDDDEMSTGGPVEWKQAVADAKDGNADASLVLGLLGDPDVPGGTCEEMSVEGGANASVRLREFVESVPHGSWGSVCMDDYADFFADAVSLVGLTCDEFTPPG